MRKEIVSIGIGMVLSGVVAHAEVQYPPFLATEGQPIRRDVPESQFGSGPADPATKQVEVGSAQEMQGDEVAVQAAKQTTTHARTDGGRMPASVPGAAPQDQFVRGRVDSSNVEVYDRSPASMGGPDYVVPTGQKGVQEFSLIVNRLGFFPKAIFVTRDIPVRLFVTGSGKEPMCIMMDSFNVRKTVRSNEVEEIRFTPGFPGQYRFYCPINGQAGTLIVKEG